MKIKLLKNEEDILFYAWTLTLFLFFSRTQCPTEVVSSRSYTYFCRSLSDDRVKLTFATLKILGFYGKKWKIDDFHSHFLIWSSKIPKGVCIYYERSIFWLFKKHNSFYLWLLELYFFWLRKLVLEGALQILPRHFIHQKSARRSSPLTF